MHKQIVLSGSQNALKKNKRSLKNQWTVQDIQALQNKEILKLNNGSLSSTQ